MKKPFALTLLMFSISLVMGQVEDFIPFPPYNIPLPKGTQRVVERYAWGKADSVNDQEFQRWSYRSLEYDADGMLFKKLSYYYHPKPSDTEFVRSAIQVSPNDPKLLMYLPYDEFGVKIRLPLDHYPQIKKDSTGRIVQFIDFCEMYCEGRTQYAFEYDSSGKLAQIREIDRSWRSQKRWHFSYDATGKLSCLKEIQPEGDADTYQYRYDDHGRLESTRLNLSYFLPKRWFVTRYAYDSLGRIVSAVTYMDNRRQVVHWTIFYFYDAG